MATEIFNPNDYAPATTAAAAGWTTTGTGDPATIQSDGIDNYLDLTADLEGAWDSAPAGSGVTEVAFLVSFTGTYLYSYPIRVNFADVFFAARIEFGGDIQGEVRAGALLLASNRSALEFDGDPTNKVWFRVQVDGQHMRVRWWADGSPEPSDYTGDQSVVYDNTTPIVFTGTTIVDENGRGSPDKARIYLFSQGTDGDPAPLTSSDTTPPTFDTAPATGTITTTSAQITATLDEGGTLKGILLTDGATAPTGPAQAQTWLTAGVGSNNVVAVFDVAATASVQATGTFSSIDPGTAYDAYVWAEDDEGTPNVQAATTLVELTTLSNVSAISNYYRNMRV